MATSKFVENGLREMEETLRQAKVGRLALSDGNMPYIVPLNFLYHERKIAFHCALEGKKLNLISKNPNCCFEVDEFMGDVSYHYGSLCHLDYDSVLAFGKARIENNQMEKVRLLQLFGEKYDERYRKPTSEGGIRLGMNREAQCCCVVIDVEELTGRRERTVEGKRQKTMWQHHF